jgi:hypothetical protein
MGINSAVLQSPYKAKHITLESETQVQNIGYRNNVCQNHNHQESKSRNLGSPPIDEPAGDNAGDGLTDTETYHRHEGIRLLLVVTKTLMTSLLEDNNWYEKALVE